MNVDLTIQLSNVSLTIDSFHSVGSLLSECIYLKPLLPKLTVKPFTLGTVKFKDPAYREHAFCMVREMSCSHFLFSFRTAVGCEGINILSHLRCLFISIWDSAESGLPSCKVYYLRLLNIYGYWNIQRSLKITVTSTEEINLYKGYLTKKFWNLSNC